MGKNPINFKFLIFYNFSFINSFTYLHTQNPRKKNHSLPKLLPKEIKYMNEKRLARYFNSFNKYRKKYNHFWKKSRGKVTKSLFYKDLINLKTCRKNVNNRIIHEYTCKCPEEKWTILKNIHNDQVSHTIPAIQNWFTNRKSVNETHSNNRIRVRTSHYLTVTEIFNEIQHLLLA